MSTHAGDMERIAANLSNLSTIGYKRVTSSIQEFRLPSGVRGTKTTLATDFSQGEVARTGRPLDLALDGEGFFAVETGTGEGYTRNGNFFVDPNGVLVTGKGEAVAWDRFLAPIDPTGFPVVVNGDGTVRQGDRELGRLRIVNFEDLQQLRQDRSGHWIAPRGLRETTHTAVVHQFALEESNASGIHEMISMIAIQRTFENSARMLQTINESYQRLTRPF